VTITPHRPAEARPAELAPAEDLITATIDGFEVRVPKGTLIIRAAEQIGLQIPRFCDHPLLDPVGACRQCIVEVEGQRKPLTACTSTLADGYVVKTQLTSSLAEKAQRGTMELLLINHPLDCPVCDKGGECPLQNQAMSNGAGESRFTDRKRTFAKPVPISSQVLLDRERCVLCARCTRFSEQIAGDPFIGLFERGALQQVAIYADEPFESYFSGNTVQICPVGALTGASYRFHARPFDLVSTPSVCEHCASGCAQRTDHRRGRVQRRLAGSDPAVNEEWNCDKGRWAFSYATLPDRLTTPLVRDGESGELVAASWTHALEVAAAGIGRARSAAVLTGGRLTVEDSYAYAKLARLVLGTNDVDFRARVSSAEETAFLGSHVAGTGPADGSAVTYADVEAAPTVVLVGFEAEEESPILFLRLRKAARDRRLRVFGIAPFASPGLTKTLGTLLQARPSEEAAVLTALASEGGEGVLASAAAALRQPGAVLLVGERLAGVPGGLTAAAQLSAATGARLAWVPRRAGERGALEAGLHPGLLPGGRPVSDPDARAEVAAVWGVDADRIPTAPGRDTAGILAGCEAGEIQALVLAGVDVADLPDPHAAVRALDRTGFLVVTDLRASTAARLADVVLPVAAVTEKAGTFLDWEGRARTFEQVLPQAGIDQAHALPDTRVAEQLASEIGMSLGLRDVPAARRELAALGVHRGPRLDAPAVQPAPLAEPGRGEALVASWHWLLDDGALQDGETHLAGTRKAPRLHLSAATATEIGAAPGSPVVVTGPAGSVTLPLVVAPLPDRVVWLPTKSPGCHLHADLGVVPGAVVRVEAVAASTLTRVTKEPS